MTAAWRWLAEPAEAAASPGPWNMGLDEALLASAAAHGRATLRLYTWQGPWLSLGYAQRLAPAHQQACREAGVGVVRRLTGGRAVLHGADLTYAVAAPESCFPPGLRGSYDRIGAVLVNALAALGVAVDRVAEASPSGPRPLEFDCFAQPARDELCVSGRKLAGSAQRRLRGAFLQHGSLRIAPDPPTACRAAGLRPGVATSLRELGVEIEPAPLARRVADAFRAVLAVDLDRAPATPEELGWAARRGAEPPPAGGPPERRQLLPSSVQVDRR